MSSRHLTIAELAKRSRVHYVMISNYLKGSKSGKLPSLGTMLKLAKGLNCTLEELTGLAALHGIEAQIPKYSESTMQIIDFLQSRPDDDPEKAIILKLIRLMSESQSTEDKSNGS